MEDKLLLGKLVADKIKENVRSEVKILRKNGVFPKLVTLRVGNKSDDVFYEKSATNVLLSLGIDVENIVLDYNVSQDVLKERLICLNDDNDVNGILMFRPLPSHIDENYICDLIDIRKDVDSISKYSLANVFLNDENSIKPCTAQAVIEILRFYNICLTGKKVVVLGRSNVIGKPVALLLCNEDATVTLVHSKSLELEKICKDADIIVSCVGRANFVDSNFVGDGKIVIDVGINEDENGNVVGDVNFSDVIDKVSFITPVPRGVGSVTTSILAQNLIFATKMQF